MSTNQPTRTTLIKGYVRAGRAGEALGAFRRMKLAGHQQVRAKARGRWMDGWVRSIAFGGTGSVKVGRRSACLYFGAPILTTPIPPPKTMKQDLAVCTAVLEALARHRPTMRTPGSTSTSAKDRMLDFWMEMRLHGVEPDAVVRCV